MENSDDRVRPILEVDTEPVRWVEVGGPTDYISVDEIFHLFRGVETDDGHLDDPLVAAAAVVFSDDDVSLADPSTDELVEQEEAETPTVFAAEDDFLAHIDVDDTVGLYVKEVVRVPLLTAAEELELSRRIERGRLAREELALGNISQAHYAELRMSIEDGWAAREHLIVANSRLVISVAKKYMGRGVPFLDLIQEGNIGLMRAAKKFDYHRGYKFSTYATWWIRQAITRALADQCRTIRLPVYIGDQINRILRLEHQLKQQLNRDPSEEELAAALGIPQQKVAYMLMVARRPVSLQTPVGEEDDDDVLGDFIEDRDNPTPDDTATRNLLREHLEDILNRLPPREARILQLRYGLLDGRSLTLNEVGRKLGVTRERVRQIEAQALRRLRSQSIQRELRAYIE